MFLGTLAGGLLAAPLAAGAQAPGRYTTSAYFRLPLHRPRLIAAQLWYCCQTF